MAALKKEFILTHVFKSISSVNDDVFHYSPTAEHFGVPWKIEAGRRNGLLALFLFCKQEKSDKKWSIETWFEAKLSAVNAGAVLKQCEHTFKSTNNNSWGWPAFIKWEDLMKEYVVEDTLKVEIRVKIRKMVGIKTKKNLMKFDESTKEFSDVVLVVENQKFYVSKLFLARNSSYFKTLLMGNFEESGKPEVTLSDIDANDFQSFLELVHGESPIEKSTIDGILHLADMYDVELAIRKCEQFMIESSRKTLKQKLRLAHLYSLENLKDHCLSKVTTAADICSVLADDLNDMDPSVVGALLHKSLALREK